jgi:transcriptional regulator with XRE-family HTH domain
MMTDAAPPPDRFPNPVDRHVGFRIRDLRKRLRISQERLAEELGLTFQQVQKYEKGSNRVSASKLYEIARALKVQVGYFFEGLADPATDAAYGVAEPEQAAFVHDLASTPEAAEIARLLSGLKARRRKLVLEMVRQLAGQDAGAEE